MSAHDPYLMRLELRRDERIAWADAVNDAVAALAYNEPWSPKADLALFESLLRGVPTVTDQMTRRACKLMAPCRRSDGRVAIDGQAVMLAALRQKAGAA